MTPKEKALELCYLYQGDFEKGTLNMSWTMAKKCALILVNEMLNNFLSNRTTKYGRERYQYWQKVKQEIEKQ